MTFPDFNFNDVIRVKLAPWAAEKIVQGRLSMGIPAKAAAIIVDAEGYSKWGLYDLMDEVFRLTGGPVNDPPIVDMAGRFVLAKPDAALAPKLHEALIEHADAAVGIVVHHKGHILDVLPFRDEPRWRAAGYADAQNESGDPMQVYGEGDTSTAALDECAAGINAADGYGQS